MRIAKKILLVLFSLAITIILLSVFTNYYLEKFNLAQQPEYISWTIYETKYSPRYIYWEKSYCELFPKDCKYEEEHLLTHKVEIFSAPESKMVENCTKILFLGDSFTIAPWVPVGDSYASQVSKGYAEINNTCVRQYRLATGGVGNNQELARFSDVVGQIQPDIVIWQFYLNDIYENIIYSLYKVENNELVKRNTLYNFTFLAGFLNQRIPLLAESVLGKHLMYLGEFKDVFHYWQADIKEIESIVSHNKLQVPLLVAEMKKLSEANNFKLYTTLAPLEKQAVSMQTNEPWYDIMQNSLREILQANSDYISMESPVPSHSQVLGEFTPKDNNFASLFGPPKDKNPVGARHLTLEGNIYYGSVLLQNFIAREQIDKNSEINLEKE